MAYTDLDLYGGWTDLPSPNGATGKWRVEQLSSGRWIFVTPLGNMFWLKSIYNYRDANSGWAALANGKYGSYNTGLRVRRDWAKATVGFNTVGPYAGNAVFPMRYTGWDTDAGLQPGIRQLLTSRYGAAANAVQSGHKNIIYACLRTAPAAGQVRYDTNYNGATTARVFPDAFDSNFRLFLRETLQGAPNTGGSSWVAPPKGPWILGWATDDRDEMFGWGPDQRLADIYPGATSPHPRPALAAAIGAPSFTTSYNGNVNPPLRTYTDGTNYTKLAWRNFLVAKYGTIDALNTAWRNGGTHTSNYTTFDSAGGWPSGTGILDESGNAVNGNLYGTGGINVGYRYQGASAALVADLDQFDGRGLPGTADGIAENYWKIHRQELDAWDPGGLLFCTMTLAAHSKPGILEAAGAYCDAIMHGGLRDTVSSGIFEYAYGHHQRPVYMQTFMTAKDDSPQTEGAWGLGTNFATQEARGQGYQDLVTDLVNLASAGEPFCVGLIHFELVDSGTEGQNFGLLTASDNAYDGVEAVGTYSVDANGRIAGGETHGTGELPAQTLTLSATSGDAVTATLSSGVFVDGDKWRCLQATASGALAVVTAVTASTSITLRTLSTWPSTSMATGTWKILTPNAQKHKPSPTLTFSGGSNGLTVGSTGVTCTADAALFNSVDPTLNTGFTGSQVGAYIRQNASGSGGRFRITGYVSPTVVTGTVDTAPFASTSAPFSYSFNGSYGRVVWSSGTLGATISLTSPDGVFRSSMVGSPLSRLQNGGVWGIVEISSVTSATVASGTVRKPIPSAAWLTAPGGSQEIQIPISYGDFITGLSAATQIPYTVLIASGSSGTPSAPVVQTNINAGASSVRGTGQINAVVTLRKNATVTLGTASVASSTAWTVTNISPTLIAGDSIDAKQTVNSVDSAFSSPAVIVTAGAPSTPSVNSPIYGNALQVTGIGTPSAMITVYGNLATISTTSAGAASTWVLTLSTPLAVGTDVTATQTVGGVTGQHSSIVTVELFQSTRIFIKIAPPTGARLVRVLLRAVVPVAYRSRYVKPTTLLSQFGVPPTDSDLNDVQTGTVAEEIRTIALRTPDIDSLAEVQEAALQAWNEFQGRVENLTFNESDALTYRDDEQWS